MTTTRPRPDGRPRRWPLASILLAAALLGGLGPASSPLAAQAISGRLMDVNTEQPINLGLVILLTEQGDSISSTITNERGFFSLSSPEAGNFLLLASALGYRETTAGLFELGPGGAMTVEFRIAPEPIPLDSIVVSLNRPVLEHALVRNGFVRRLQRGLGAFLTPHDVEQSTATNTEALLQNIPGVVVRPTGGLTSFLGDEVLMRSVGGGFCSPTLFIDGVKIPYEHSSGVTLSSLVPINQVEAVEIYRRASEIPVEYGITQGSGGADGMAEGCGAMLFWTKSR